MIVASVQLWYFAGSSDKVYKAVVTNNNGHFTLTAYWGRRGRTMQFQVKAANTSQWIVMREFHALVASKTRKGYREMNNIPA